MNRGTGSSRSDWVTFALVLTYLSTRRQGPFAWLDNYLGRTGPALSSRPQDRSYATKSVQPPRQRVLSSLHFITGNFWRFEFAAIDHGVGKPDISPIDLVRVSLIRQYHFPFWTWHTSRRFQIKVRAAQRFHCNSGPQECPLSGVKHPTRPCGCPDAQVLEMQFWTQTATASSIIGCSPPVSALGH